VNGLDTDKDVVEKHTNGKVRCIQNSTLSYEHGMYVFIRSTDTNVLNQYIKITCPHHWFWGFGLLYRHTASPPITAETHTSGLVLVLVCYAATQLAIQLQQERIHWQVVHSNRQARKRPTESNSTPAMDLGFEDIRIRRYTNKRGLVENTHP